MKPRRVSVSDSLSSPTSNSLLGGISAEKSTTGSDTGDLQEGEIQIGLDPRPRRSISTTESSGTDPARVFLHYAVSTSGGSDAAGQSSASGGKDSGDKSTHRQHRSNSTVTSSSGDGIRSSGTPSVGDGTQQGRGPIVRQLSVPIRQEIVLGGDYEADLVDDIDPEMGSGKLLPNRVKERVTSTLPSSVAMRMMSQHQGANRDPYTRERDVSHDYIAPTAPPQQSAVRYPRGSVSSLANRRVSVSGIETQHHQPEMRKQGSTPSSIARGRVLTPSARAPAAGATQRQPPSSSGTSVGNLKLDTTQPTSAAGNQQVLARRRDSDDAAMMRQPSIPLSPRFLGSPSTDMPSAFLSAPGTPSADQSDRRDSVVSSSSASTSISMDSATSAEGPKFVQTRVYPAAKPRDLRRQMLEFERGVAEDMKVAERERLLKEAMERGADAVARARAAVLKDKILNSQVDPDAALTSPFAPKLSSSTQLLESINIASEPLSPASAAKAAAEAATLAAAAAASLASNDEDSEKALAAAAAAAEAAAAAAQAAVAARKHQQLPDKTKSPGRTRDNPDMLSGTRQDSVGSASPALTASTGAKAEAAAAAASIEADKPRHRRSRSLPGHRRDTSWLRDQLASIQPLHSIPEKHRESEFPLAKVEGSVTSSSHLTTTASITGESIMSGEQSSSRRTSSTTDASSQSSIAFGMGLPELPPFPDQHSDQGPSGTNSPMSPELRPKQSHARSQRGSVDYSYRQPHPSEPRRKSMQTDKVAKSERRASVAKPKPGGKEKSRKKSVVSTSKQGDGDLLTSRVTTASTGTTTSSVSTEPEFPPMPEWHQPAAAPVVLHGTSEILGPSPAVRPTQPEQSTERSVEKGLPRPSASLLSKLKQATPLPLVSSATPTSPTPTSTLSSRYSNLSLQIKDDADELKVSHLSTQRSLQLAQPESAALSSTRSKPSPTVGTLEEVDVTFTISPEVEKRAGKRETSAKRSHSRTKRSHRKRSSDRMRRSKHSDETSDSESSSRSRSGSRSLSESESMSEDGSGTEDEAESSRHSRLRVSKQRGKDSDSERSEDSSRRHRRRKSRSRRNNRGDRSRTPDDHGRKGRSDRAGKSGTGDSQPDADTINTPQKAQASPRDDGIESSESDSNNVSRRDPVVPHTKPFEALFLTDHHDASAQSNYDRLRADAAWSRLAKHAQVTKLLVDTGMPSVQEEIQSGGKGWAKGSSSNATTSDQTKAEASLSTDADKHAHQSDRVYSKEDLYRLTVEQLVAEMLQLDDGLPSDSEDQEERVQVVAVQDASAPRVPTTQSASHVPQHSNTAQKAGTKSETSGFSKKDLHRLAQAAVTDPKMKAILALQVQQRRLRAEQKAALAAAKAQLEVVSDHINSRADSLGKLIAARARDLRQQGVDLSRKIPSAKAKASAPVQANQYAEAAQPTPSTSSDGAMDSQKPMSRSGDGSKPSGHHAMKWSLEAEKEAYLEAARQMYSGRTAAPVLVEIQNWAVTRAAEAEAAAIPLREQEKRNEQLLVQVNSASEISKEVASAISIPEETRERLVSGLRLATIQTVLDEREQLSAVAEAFQKARALLQASLGVRAEERAQAERELEMARERESNLKAQLTGARVELSEVTAQLQQREQDLAEVRKERDRLQAQFAEVSQQLATSENRLATLRNSLMPQETMEAQRRMAMKTLSAELAALRESNEQLRAENRKLRRRIHLRDVQLQYQADVLRLAQSQGFVIVRPAANATLAALGQAPRSAWVAAAIKEELRAMRKVSRGSVDVVRYRTNSLSASADNEDQSSEKVRKTRMRKATMTSSSSSSSSEASQSGLTRQGSSRLIRIEPVLNEEDEEAEEESTEDEGEDLDRFDSEDEAERLIVTTDDTNKNDDEQAAEEKDERPLDLVMAEAWAAGMKTFRNVIYGASAWPKDVFSLSDRASAVIEPIQPGPPLGALGSPGLGRIYGGNKQEDASLRSADLPIQPSRTKAGSVIPASFPLQAEEMNARALSMVTGRAPRHFLTNGASYEGEHSSGSSSQGAGGVITPVPPALNVGVQALLTATAAAAAAAGAGTRPVSGVPSSSNSNVLASAAAAAAASAALSAAALRSSYARASLGLPPMPAPRLDIPNTIAATTDPLTFFTSLLPAGSGYELIFTNKSSNSDRQTHASVSEPRLISPYPMVSEGGLPDPSLVLALAVGVNASSLNNPAKRARWRSEMAHYLAGYSLDENALRVLNKIAARVSGSSNSAPGGSLIPTQSNASRPGSPPQSNYTGTPSATLQVFLTAMSSQLRSTVWQALAAELRPVVRRELEEQALCEIRCELWDRRAVLLIALERALRRQVAEELRAKFRDEVIAQLKQDLAAVVKSELSDSVREVWFAALKEKVREQLEEEVRESVRITARREWEDEALPRLRAECMVQAKQRVRQEALDRIREELRAEATKQALDTLAAEWKASASEVARAEYERKLEEAVANAKREVREEVERARAAEIQQLKDEGWALRKELRALQMRGIKLSGATVMLLNQPETHDPTKVPSTWSLPQDVLATSVPGLPGLSTAIAGNIPSLQTRRTVSTQGPAALLSDLDRALSPAPAGRPTSPGSPRPPALRPTSPGSPRLHSPSSPASPTLPPKVTKPIPARPSTARSTASGGSRTKSPPVSLSSKYQSSGSSPRQPGSRPTSPTAAASTPPALRTTPPTHEDRTGSRVLQSKESSISGDDPKKVIDVPRKAQEPSTLPTHTSLVAEHVPGSILAAPMLPSTSMQGRAPYQPNVQQRSSVEVRAVMPQVPIAAAGGSAVIPPVHGSKTTELAKRTLVPAQPARSRSSSQSGASLEERLRKVGIDPPADDDHPAASGLVGSAGISIITRQDVALRKEAIDRMNSRTQLATNLLIGAEDPVRQVSALDDVAPLPVPQAIAAQVMSTHLPFSSMAVMNRMSRPSSAAGGHRPSSSNPPMPTTIGGNSVWADQMVALIKETAASKKQT